MELQPGDIFCTKNPMWLGTAINFVQRTWDPDNQAEYSHAGIVTSKGGETFEALWTAKNSSLDSYRGQRVIIGRHNAMDESGFKLAYADITQHRGQWYPFHRLLFFLIPPLAKYVHLLNRPVCSELAAKFLVHAGIFKTWAGKSPDYLADTMRDVKGWTVVFEGVWE